MNPQIKCFLGVIGSGKDYQCQKLEEQGYVKVDFADGLRQFAWAILNWEPSNENEYEEFKRSPITMIVGEENGNQYIIDDYIDLCNGREFLQNLGSRCRELDPDFWISIWKDKVTQLIGDGYSICCSDLRYENELVAAMDLGADIIFCNYKSDRYNDSDPHESETMNQRFSKMNLSDGHQFHYDVLDYYLKKYNENCLHK